MQSKTMRRARTRTGEVWKALDDVFALCDKKTWEDNNTIQLRKVLSKFEQVMIKGWSMNNITHYMVSKYDVLCIPFVPLFLSKN